MTFQIDKQDRSILDHLKISRDEIDIPTLRKCAAALGLSANEMWDQVVYDFRSLADCCRYTKLNGELCGDGHGATPEGFPRCQHHRDKAHYDFRDELLDPANIGLQEVVLTQLMAACNDPRWFGHPFFSNLRNELAEAVKDHLSAHGKDELETIKDIWS